MYNVNVLNSVQSNKKIMKQPNFLEEKSAQHPILCAKATTKKEIKNNVYIFFRLYNTIIYKEIKQNCGLEGLFSELFIELLLYIRYTPLHK